MKLWLGMGVALVVFSGCNSTQNIQLERKNAQQALIIQQQQLKIEALTKALSSQKKGYRTRTVVPKTKKNIKLKKVEDNNFNSDYMYPQTRSTPKSKKVTKLAQTETTTTASSVMGKAECIAMIGQEKFDKYTQMFGSESASIKRCKMLKAMRN
ncbi:hypothetical protein [Sulfurovum sp.]|uniref:hypothetical protein n=1 Tax=Sulfurovum sp. TaxID=1969726 RepID=UPI0025F63ADA|nr:hypothetical protein [Sulfurovum sp.]